MFRIAKNLVKTLEESVSGAVSEGPSDSYFQSIPPQLFAVQDGKSGYFQERESLCGLRVVQVDETQLQLSSFFDFVIGFNNEPVPTLSQTNSSTIYPDYAKIVEKINEHCGSSIKLHIWSGKGGIYREEYLYVSPRKSLSEVPLDDTDFSRRNDPVALASSTAFESLGFKVQWTPLVAATFTYHVLQLNIENGPAMQAGLIPDQDYILACQDGLLATGGEHLLQDIVRSRANHSLVLYVYNKSVDCVRPVTVQIGPNGRLGCNVGYGFLHRIPSQTHRSQDTDSDPQVILPAAKQPFLVQPPVPHTAPRRHSHQKTNASAATAMADYFQEGKDQSPAPKKTSPPPPPPISTNK